jgi:hypothetical protein
MKGIDKANPKLGVRLVLGPVEVRKLVQSSFFHMYYFHRDF